jgi:hypothetical protein
LTWATLTIPCLINAVRGVALIKSLAKYDRHPPFQILHVLFKPGKVLLKTRVLRLQCVVAAAGKFPQQVFELRQNLRNFLGELSAFCAFQFHPFQASEFNSRREIILKIVKLEAFLSKRCTELFINLQNDESPSKGVDALENHSRRNLPFHRLPLFEIFLYVAFVLLKQISKRTRVTNDFYTVMDQKLILEVAHCADNGFHANVHVFHFVLKQRIGVDVNFGLRNKTTCNLRVYNIKWKHSTSRVAAFVVVPSDSSFCGAR